MECVEIGNAVLYHGDAREVLPQLAAMEALITDPVWPNVPAGLLQGSGNPTGLFREMWQSLTEMPARAVIVMRNDSDPRFLRVVPDSLPFFHAAQLPYVMPGYMGRKMGGDEIAYCFGAPIPSAPGQRVIPARATLSQPKDRERNGHPCSRSIVHFRWLMRWWTEPTDTVCDPFCGSGTTGVAAVESGRKFIGIEIERRFFDIACKRLYDAQRQQRMFA